MFRFQQFSALLKLRFIRFLLFLLTPTHQSPNFMTYECLKWSPYLKQQPNLKANMFSLCQLFRNSLKKSQSITIRLKGNKTRYDWLDPPKQVHELDTYLSQSLALQSTVRLINLLSRANSSSTSFSMSANGH